MNALTVASAIVAASALSSSCSFASAVLSKRGSSAVAQSRPTTSSSSKSQNASSSTVSYKATSSAKPSSGKFPAKFFAPYAPLDVLGYGFDLANGPSKYYFLAFVLADSKNQPCWNGQDALENSSTSAAIKALRAKGGDVAVSFGGAAGTELGYVIKNADQLAAAYQKVITTYGLKWIDLDIEGGMLAGPSVDVRNKAVSKLQKANPGLSVSYTLACDSSGLNSLSLDLLKNAKSNGVRVDVVGCMLMDAGADNSQSMIISGAKAAKKQIDSIGLKSDVGITIMIGQNDTPGVTSLADAKAVSSFAKQTPWVRWTSFWSVARDNGGCPGKKAADPKCSGVTQGKHDFSGIFSS